MLNFREGFDHKIFIETVKHEEDVLFILQDIQKDGDVGLINVIGTACIYKDLIDIRVHDLHGLYEAIEDYNNFIIKKWIPVKEILGHVCKVS